MSSVAIAPDRWRSELDSFSRQHEGWIVSLTTRTADGTVGVQARDVPLEGVSQASPDADDIVVQVGGSDGHMSHEIRGVTAVTIDMADDRARRALVVDSRDGTQTTIAFRSPVRPEEVDGLPMERG
ncbi:MAG TPA: DUF5335 family protein [Vicinamibacterales bacterium]|nr:DUF5335 family protein [Vicinamibacterales bacterium]